MNRKLVIAAAALAAAGGASSVALAAGTGANGSRSAASRLDDGKDLLPQATISEQQAVAAAQSAASGALNEVDLEHYEGHLVFNVDVGRHDVKVDAGNGTVLAAPQDDE